MNEIGKLTTEINLQKADIGKNIEKALSTELDLRKRIEHLEDELSAATQKAIAFAERETSLVEDRDQAKKQLLPQNICYRHLMIIKTKLCLNVKSVFLMPILALWMNLSFQIKGK